MIPESYIFYIKIAVLVLVVAGLVYVVTILNSAKYETDREFEIRNNQKFKKGRK